MKNKQGSIMIQAGVEEWFTPGTERSEFVVPEGIKEIETCTISSFYGDAALKSVEIPASVTKIGWGAFLNCKLLASVRYGGTKAQWNSIAELYNNKELLNAEVTCADGTQKPEELGTLLTSGSIVCGHTDAIPVSLEIPNGITAIGASAFSFCYSLERVLIPESVKKIGMSAFFSCKSLKNVKIPDGVVKIDVLVFSNCDSLEYVEIPASVTTIGWGAFDGCESLSEVRYSGTKAQWNSIAGLYDGRDKPLLRATVVCTDGMQKPEVTPDGFALVGSILCWTRDIPKIAEIPDGVTAIGQYAFDCKPIKSVKIPASVKEIGDDAFYGCKSLTDVVIPESVQEIGQDAFSNCTSLKCIEIPRSVKEIKDSAFHDCKSLVDVMIPESVQEIGSFAFAYCTSLKSIEIPKSVKVISEYTFIGCVSLSEVVIPEGVTGIDTGAFNECKSLKHIEIPASVTKIGENAFVKCRKKLVVRYGGTRAQWENVTANAAFDKGAVIQCTDGEIEIREKTKLDN